MSYFPARRALGQDEAVTAAVSSIPFVGSASSIVTGTESNPLYDIPFVSDISTAPTPTKPPPGSQVPPGFIPPKSSSAGAQIMDVLTSPPGLAALVIGGLLLLDLSKKKRGRR